MVDGAVDVADLLPVDGREGFEVSEDVGPAVDAAGTVGIVVTSRF